jgi:hypothetical protein
VFLYSAFLSGTTNIDSIEAKVCYQLNCRGREFLASCVSAGWDGEVDGVGPAANAEKCLHGAVLLLEEIQLLDATVDIVSGVAPAVSFPVDLQVCPLIG